MADKAKFVSDVCEALIKNGDGRYDWLMDTPIHYEETDGYGEYLTCGTRYINVTCNSLPAYLPEIRRMVLGESSKSDVSRERIEQLKEVFE